MGELNGAIRALVLCPNQCEVLIEPSKEMEHRLVCPDEVLACKYLSIGCTDTFKRADEESHYENCSILHNGMATKLSQSIFQDLDMTRKNIRADLEMEQKKLMEQNEMIRQLREDLRVKLNEKEELINKLSENFDKEKERSDKQDETIRKLEQENKQCKEDIKRLNERIQQLQIRLSEHEKKRAQKNTYIPFSLNDYTGRKRTPRLWSENFTSKGYRFCIQIHANGFSESRNKAISVGVVALKGDDDATVKWPLEASLVLTLCKALPEGEDKTVIESVTWQRPEEAEVKDPECFTYFTPEPLSQYPHAFIPHSKVKSFLNNDKLEFKLSVSPNH